MARLTRDDWISAAYECFSADGITAVAVEPVARSVGATKGSFYWHFTDRRALVDAVLKRWSDLETERLIAQVERIEPPQARLAGLLELIAHRTGERSGERTLYADATSEPVRSMVAAVTERRVSYLASLLVAAGVGPDEARRRAVVIVSAVIGYQQLVSSGWDAAADPRTLVETLRGLAAGNDEGRRP
ncbi:TetR/AcrR family transcriptional regulator [Microbacterium sulfonylureivorans]|uniref:TetR/AcrR family transcriptional regulator n=1 Tax=Microbacterium sulfonylureivorans TaxID=2486854 RepID=UPI000FD7D66B|nr:TetR/AcrR family transcriptional regulator [Microbacterium sulfonylureivorans]